MDSSKAVSEENEFYDCGKEQTECIHDGEKREPYLSDGDDEDADYENFTQPDPTQSVADLGDESGPDHEVEDTGDLNGGGRDNRSESGREPSYEEDDSDTEEREAPQSDGRVQVMFKELQLISAQLKVKNIELSEREERLNSREFRLQVREDELEKTYEKLLRNFHKTVDDRNSLQLKQLKLRVSDLVSQLKEKARENRRLKLNFETLQESHTGLKSRVIGLEEEKTRLEKQASSLRQRLENLQRCQELKDKQMENIIAEMRPATPHKKKKSKTSKSNLLLTPASDASEVLRTLLEWTVRDVVKPSYERSKTLDTTLRASIIDNCTKMLPALCDMLKLPVEPIVASPGRPSEASPGIDRRLGLPSLQFIYWSCLLLDQFPGKQSVGIQGCMRRLADELYRPLRSDASKVSMDSAPLAKELATPRYVRSSDLHVRMLSYLLLVRALNQVDCLANVFSLLKQDLRDELSKELFVHYHGVQVLLPHFKPSAKAHLATVLDIYLLMCVDSTQLRPFLTCCSTEAWFRAVSAVIKIPNLDQRHVEKVSVVLQKLSKSRDNRRLFDMFSLRPQIQELIHSTHPTDTNSFLILNLKSVLYNLSTTNNTIS